MFRIEYSKWIILINYLFDVQRQVREVSRSRPFRICRGIETYQGDGYECFIIYFGPGDYPSFCYLIGGFITT